MNTPARFGNGYRYLIEIPGAEDVRVLADTRELDEIYAEASTGDGILRFQGVEVDGEAEGKPFKMSLGGGRVHAGPDSGTIVSYYDPFHNIDKTPGVDEDEDDQDDEKKKPGAPSKPSRPSMFPNVR